MVDLETLVSLCKRRGFVFPSSEIYGGFGGFWDYGPLGVELKRNLKDAWWRANVQERDDVVGVDTSVIMSPRVWEASEHLRVFTDPLVDCKNCRRRSRVDELVDGRCPYCSGEVTEPRQFNLMFKTFIGPVEEDASVAYLRPETAQGMFVNFKNVQTTSRKKLPFGIAQIGKAFRNEITPGKFIFRDREFELMEIEYFCKPAEGSAVHQRWIQDRLEWYVRFGLARERLSLYEYPVEELAHYAKATSDIFYEFPFGKAELEGIAYRADFDLSRHQQASGEDLTFFDDETNERYVAHVVEPAAGVDRLLLAFLIDAYHEEPDKEGTRVVLKLHPQLAPYKVAVLPLSRKEPLAEKAQEVARLVRPHVMTTYDDSQSIGRRYRRQDEIGTPWCVTVDFQSLDDNAVTIRDRDTMTQDRIPIAELVATIKQRLGS